MNVICITKTMHNCMLYRVALGHVVFCVQTIHKYLAREYNQYLGIRTGHPNKIIECGPWLNEQKKKNQHLKQESPFPRSVKNIYYIYTYVFTNNR